ncbi:MAG TPA: cyclic 2,3-diphosphoglycerate synthase [Syntrophobacteria bacterium]|nr:cyclic 2,3-diphosphoglycerate synthase [Syntrophobacteria bacterium]
MKKKGLELEEEQGMQKGEGQRRVVIMGAGGRDFHNFNMAFRDDPSVRVVAFTASQIPGIEAKVYPPALAGHLYPEGIPIVAEERLPELIHLHRVDQVVFAYSDISHEVLGHLASVALAAGADFTLLGPERTMLRSHIPVISVCAVRTGCGKSQLTRHLCDILRRKGISTVVIRHPMAYGDLVRQRVQRFASGADLDAAQCTIEEREEYEPLIARNAIVYAGVDYRDILAQVERQRPQVVLWDGGNNDFPFIHSDLELVLLDPFRPGHGMLYHPGETNLRRADALIINKVNTAPPHCVERVLEIVRQVNPGATLVQTASTYQVDHGETVRGKDVVVIEDGPTVTHGGMSFGVGYLAARELGAAKIVDPRPFLQGTLRETFAEYRHIAEVLPAMGYGPQQIADLEATINAIPADLVLVATPVDLGRLLRLNKETVRLTYEMEPLGAPSPEEIVAAFIDQRGLPSRGVA